METESQLTTQKLKVISRLFELDTNASQACIFSFHMCTYDDDRAAQCGGDAGGPLFMPDLDNQGRY